MFFTIFYFNFFNTFLVKQCLVNHLGLQRVKKNKYIKCLVNHLGLQSFLNFSFVSIYILFILYNFFNFLIGKTS